MNRPESVHPGASGRFTRIRWGLWRGLRVERRPVPRLIGFYRVLAILLGLAVALLIAPVLTSTPASEFYDLAWVGTFGSSLGLTNVLAVTIPLTIAGLAAALPYRLGLWNIGIDGQILMGAWVAFGLAALFPGLDRAVLIPLMVLGAALGGALWILGPALARAYLGLNEIITTFLLNFVAVAWATYWATGLWTDPDGLGGIRSRAIPEKVELGVINLGNSFVHWGIILAVALPVAAWLTRRYTRMGYELTVTGASEQAGRYAGISVKRRLTGIMLVGGALGGVAGAVDMMGTLHQFAPALGNNTGFAAVVIAVLAGGSERAVPAMALVYAVLLVGGDAVGLAGVSPDLTFTMVGVTLLLATAGDAFARFRVVLVPPVKRTKHPSSTVPGGESATQSGEERGVS